MVRQSNAPRVAAAVARARECADRPYAPVPPDGRRRSREYAIGDPQAPLEQFMAIVGHSGLLGEDGWLDPDVALISMGDHFDWGGTDERDEAARDGLAILSWLAAHPPDQVTLLCGNHDLGRVGELADFDAASFAEAHALAVRAYRGGDPDAELEAELLGRFPALPTAELAARDFAAFCPGQRDRVTELLRARRLRVACAREAALFCHAGVTVDDLARIGLTGPTFTAGEVATALDEALHRAVERWTGGPLTLPELHRPGDSGFGEGGGIFYHRPTNPDTEVAPDLLEGPFARRYDACRLPRGITQVVGHIGDSKCRSLLGPWAEGHPAPLGSLRHLVTDGRSVAYRTGLPTRAPVDHAVMIFTDGHMKHAPPEQYQLYPVSG